MREMESRKDGIMIHGRYGIMLKEGIYGLGGFNGCGVEDVGSHQKERWIWLGREK